MAYKYKINPYTGKLDRVIDETELSSGDMEKDTYDTDEDSIIDKAESLDDGEGNSVTASAVVNAVNKTENDRVHIIIDSIDQLAGDIVLTSTDSSALQTAINSLTDKQVLEIRTNATYDPIEVPSGKEFIVKVTAGYCPIISGANCIKLKDGVDKVTISGIKFYNYSTSDTNGKGSAIYLEHNAKVTNLIFHRLKFSPTTNGSAVLLSYHQTVGDDTYYTANELSEMSERIAFVDCHFYKACADGTEGASILLRGVKYPFLKGNKINNEDTEGRGIMLHNCLYALIEKNEIHSPGGSNGEAIKVDSIGSPSFQNIALIKENIVKDATEGIDVDDTQSALVVDNIAYECGEGITVDDSSTAVLLSNYCYNNTDGIYLEDGATACLGKNISFNNSSNNYKIENGYSLPASNSEDITDILKIITANNLPYNGTLDSSNVSDALDEVASDITSLEARAKVYTFNLPTTTIANGQSMQLHRFTVPAGKQVKVWAAGLSSAAGTSVSGAKIRIYNESDSQEEYSTNSTIVTGEPIDTLTVAEKDISISVLNDSGLQGDFNGFISITIEAV